VVVDKFDIFRTSIIPDKADPPLCVYPDAVLPATIPAQLLETVTGWGPQILHILRRVEDFELAQGRALNRAINALHVLLVPNALSISTGERPDHTAIL